MQGAASNPDQDLKREKSALRQATLARRDAEDAAARHRASQLITNKICALPSYTSARAVAAYASFGSEFDTSALLARILADGKQLLLPRINRDERALELRNVRNLDADLVAGVWGIREPAQSCALQSPATVDFMLVPGVAFTSAGARLGYGGGFYDRLLKLLRPGVPRVAAAFQLQVADTIPEGPQDQRIDMLLTEASTLTSPP